MARKKRVSYTLDTKGIKSLDEEEIRAILRAADEIIGNAGRSMLAKILKGSRDKKLLELGLNSCPVYGFYSRLKLEDITARIDWMIAEGYLEIKYYGKLPMIIFSEMGWEMERETYAGELLNKLMDLFESDDYSFVNELKDRNRGMILLLLQKIKDSKDTRFIPILKAWGEIEYKKVRKAISEVINYIVKENTVSDNVLILDAYRKGKVTHGY